MSGFVEGKNMGTHRAHADLDAKAVARVLQLEAAEGRTAVALPDGTTVGAVSSPPRMIEVRAFAGAADELWLDGDQVDVAYADPDFWLYVVEHVAAQDADAMVLTRLNGAALHALLDTRVEYRYAEITWPAAAADVPVTAEQPVVAAPGSPAEEPAPEFREESPQLAAVGTHDEDQPEVEEAPASRWFR